MYTTAGFRPSALTPLGGLTSCPCASTPSLARKDTSSGVTSCLVGKSAGKRSAPIGREAPPDIDITEGVGGCWDPAARYATFCPSAVTTGLHSIPVPLVRAMGDA